MADRPDPLLVLASRSPRRAELLDQIGIAYRTCAADVDETVLPGEAPADYVLRLATAKAAAVRNMEGCALPVLGADTSVVIDGTILGKPADKAQAFDMLRALSGRVHQVYSAVALAATDAAAPAAGGITTALSVTDVSFRSLEDAEIDAYWYTGEPRDKAGGYGIQGCGAVFVERIAGSYTGVVGLPLYETADLLMQQGLFRMPV
ncbi:MAG: septum formation inhibitor Maf [Gammaproteobacteria bacterium]|nr:septum formation inhibitor Maf [Gammaproteobacteria bacterium]